jgi:hypothetical protein
VGIADVLMCLSGNADIMLASDARKETVFLKSLKANDRKLIKSGEYMKDFEEKFKNLKL